MWSPWLTISANGLKHPHYLTKAHMEKFSKRVQEGGQTEASLVGPIQGGGVLGQGGTQDC